MTTELGLEPALGISLGDSVLDTDATTLALFVGDSVSGSLEDNVDIHTVNSNGGIVFQTKIDVLVDSETEVSTGGETVGGKLELLHLKSLV